MHTSPTGVSQLETSEDVRLKAYKCPAGIWTIGAGHTSAAGEPRVHPGMIITLEEAHAILREDLTKTEAAVSKHVKVPLSQNQFDALVLFVYNIGGTAFAKSTLLKVLNKGKYEAVPAQLLRWTRSDGRVLPGLVKRRHMEADLWSHVSVADIHDGPIAQKVDKPATDKSPTITHAIPAAFWATVLTHLHSLPHPPPAVMYALGCGLLGGVVFCAGALTYKLLFKGKECSSTTSEITRQSTEVSREPSLPPSPDISPEPTTP
jgi:GH24 family phage-related lysozyme (muramidase)